MWYLQCILLHLIFFSLKIIIVFYIAIIQFQINLKFKLIPLLFLVFGFINQSKAQTDTLLVTSNMNILALKCVDIEVLVELTLENNSFGNKNGFCRVYDYLNKKTYYNINYVNPPHNLKKLAIIGVQLNGNVIEFETDKVTNVIIKKIPTSDGKYLNISIKYKGRQQLEEINDNGDLLISEPHMLNLNNAKETVSYRFNTENKAKI